MDNFSVETGVDALIKLLKSEKMIAVADAAKKLGINEVTIKQWVDFLVEEKIVGVEYKFTKPFIYLNKPKDEAQEKKTKVIEKEEISLEKFKEDFFRRAQESKIPAAQIPYLWKDHVTNRLALEKSFFFQEARKRGFDDIDILWQEYAQKLSGV